MAVTSACAMSSVLAPGSSCITGSASTRTSAAYNVLLSSRRGSFNSGFAIPAAARNSVSRAESKRSLTVTATRATKEPEIKVNATANESAAALEDVVKKVQATWEKTDDKIAVSVLGGAAFVALWAAAGLIGAVDKLPLVPSLFEVVGILYSGWFINRYLLFKPDREDLFKIIDDTKAKITGQ